MDSNTPVSSEINTPVYCIKCSTFTSNKDPVVIKREMEYVKALCVVCNSKKNKFLKKNRKVVQEDSKPDLIDSDTLE